MAGRPRGEKAFGQKWVDLNYEAKQCAKAKNNGVLPKTDSLSTTEFPHCEEWSEENLPDILFYLRPPTSKYKYIKVGYLKDDTGEIAKSDEGNSIRDFDILPRRISLEVDGWLVEAWRRIDSRITYQDILDRQQADPAYGGIGLKKLQKNALQNHCRRGCRKVLNSWVEYGRRGEPHRTEVEAIEGLSYENFAYNTILSRCLSAPDRLVRLRLERHRKEGLWFARPLTVIPETIESTTYNIRHFLHDLETEQSDGTYMNNKMSAAWEVLLILQERARIHSVTHWSKLTQSCLPVTWYDRTKNKTISKQTYDGGCEKCTWTPQRDQNILALVKSSKVGLKSRKRRRSYIDGEAEYMESRSGRKMRTIEGIQRHVTSSSEVENDNENEVESDMSPSGSDISLTIKAATELNDSDEGNYDDDGESTFYLDRDEFWSSPSATLIDGNEAQAYSSARHVHTADNLAISDVNEDYHYPSQLRLGWENADYNLPEFGYSTLAAQDVSNIGAWQEEPSRDDSASILNHEIMFKNQSNSNIILQNDIPTSLHQTNGYGALTASLLPIDSRSADAKLTDHSSGSGSMEAAQSFCSQFFEATTVASSIYENAGAYDGLHGVPVDPLFLRAYGLQAQSETYQTLHGLPVPIDPQHIIPSSSCSSPVRVTATMLQTEPRPYRRRSTVTTGRTFDRNLGLFPDGIVHTSLSLEDPFTSPGEQEFDQGPVYQSVKGPEYELPPLPSRHSEVPLYPFNCTFDDLLNSDATIISEGDCDGKLIPSAIGGSQDEGNSTYASRE